MKYFSMILAYSRLTTFIPRNAHSNGLHLSKFSKEFKKQFGKITYSLFLSYNIE